MSKKSYAEHKSELEEILTQLQDPQIDLDEALKLHSKAKKIISSMEDYLSEVDKRINNIT